MQNVVLMHREGSTLTVIDFGCQNLRSKVNPRTVRIKIYVMIVNP